MSEESRALKVYNLHYFFQDKIGEANLNYNLREIYSSKNENYTCGQFVITPRIAFQKGVLNKIMELQQHLPESTRKLS